ncbi:urease accessory protein [Actinopolyspora biskrensis]|uniref:Urease accessory protein UreD n=1 Tax=Actinopolyspora biskrensis TaxID=1470178 RepID=A0A852YWP5_9ACTN|nr:urease accessory protein [Actinopolyspora biskrensis]
MRSRARLVVERDERGDSVVRELRSQAPLTLVPRRPRTGTSRQAVVHLVGSASSPLGGDDLALHVSVAPGARLSLRGIAAALALPGHGPGASRGSIRIEVADGGIVEYLPEPTVVTERADHRAELSVRLEEHARVRCRETLVLGRSGEPPGRLRTDLELERGGRRLLRNGLDIGDPSLGASHGYLGGARVLATESVVWDRDPEAPVSAREWTLMPLAAGGSLITVLAGDTITAGRCLERARAAHPAGAEFSEQ